MPPMAANNTPPAKWTLLLLLREHTDDAALKLEKRMKERVSGGEPLDKVLSDLYLKGLPSRSVTFQSEARARRLLDRVWLSLDEERTHEGQVKALRRERLNNVTESQREIVLSAIQSTLNSYDNHGKKTNKGLEWFLHGQLALTRESVLKKMIKPTSAAGDIWLICNMGVIRQGLEVPLDDVLKDHKTSESLVDFLQRYPHIRAGFDVTNMPDEGKIKAFLESVEADIEMTKLGLAWGPTTVDWHKISAANYLDLGTFLHRFALERGLPSFKRYVVHHNGRRLYSSHMKMTPHALGIRDGHILEVSERDFDLTCGDKMSPARQLLAIEYKCNPELKTVQPPNGSNTRRSRKKKKSPNLYASPEDEMGKLRQQHSRKLSLVFEEADPAFRAIRERLHSMSLQRTQPKVKCKASKSPLQSTVLSNNLSILNDAAGAVGRTSIAILVGEPDNLYKTRKLSSRHRRSKPNRATIDLHGSTKEAALAKLDEALPKWVDQAMKSSYPFVMPVEIVFGGGQHMLADAVETWIRRQKNAANAPKGLLL